MDSSVNLESPKLSKKDEEKVIDFVKTRFQSAKNDRWRQERQWYMNLAFYAGRQNIIAQDAPGNSRQFQLVTPPAPYWKARPVINKIRPMIRAEMSKLTKQKPTAYILPQSNDDADIMAARAGERIWEAMYRDAKLGSLMRRAIFWSCLSGNGFIKTYWDPYAIDELTQSPDMPPQPGKICYENITPFHLFVPDLEAIDIEDQPYVIHASIRRFESLQLTYGKENVTQQGGSAADFLDETFKSVMQINSTTKKSDTVLVREMWLKPGAFKMLPDGGVLTLAGDKLLSYWPGFPYEHKQYPFTHIRNVETGKFYGGSVIEDLIPLQREYNRTRGQIIEAKNGMAKPRLVAEQGSVDATKISSEPGQTIFYRPGFNPPKPLEMAPLPSYVENELVRIERDMADIAGQHEISKGAVPPGVHAAAAIQFLTEQDQTMLGYTYASIEEATEKIAKQTLNYVKQFWDIPRTLRVTDDDSAFDVLAFSGKSLRENTDVQIESGSAMPLSLSAKQALITDWMKFGFITPEKGLEALEMGGLNKLYDDLQTDIRQVQRENVRMSEIQDGTLQALAEQRQVELAQTQLQNPQQIINPAQLPPIEATVVPVNNFDNHALHIQKHQQYQKSQEYELLGEDAKKVVEAHVNAHIMAYGQAMMDPVRASLMQGGQPPVAPGQPGAGGGNQFTTPEGH